MTLIDNKLKESIDNITRESTGRNMGASINKSSRESIDFHPRHTERAGASASEPAQGRADAKTSCERAAPAPNNTGDWRIPGTRMKRAASMGEHGAKTSERAAPVRRPAGDSRCRSELAHSKAEEMANPTHSASPRPAFLTVVLTPTVPAERVVVVDTSMPETEVQPSGSSSSPILIVDVKPVLESMPPPPPAKREIVLGLSAPSAIRTSAPKSRKRPCANPDAAKKRRCIKDSEAGPSSSKACSSGLVSRQRAKVCGRRSSPSLWASSPGEVGSLPGEASLVSQARRAKLAHAQLASSPCQALATAGLRSPGELTAMGEARRAKLVRWAEELSLSRPSRAKLTTPPGEAHLSRVSPGEVALCLPKRSSPLLRSCSLASRPVLVG
ncbi:hypothetical protein Bca52824_011486 [Brassica carinata]|uniref:Uncharacterized protein n=1 Tax=Brassica carinata TaxID=52824 RepID=A0A8X7WDB6_BRACI|nr:hypothetical protein Bca52824_011486 [Brassica carinata]